MYTLTDGLLKLHAALLDATIDMNTFLCTLFYVYTCCFSAFFILRQDFAVVSFISSILPSPDPEGSHGRSMPLSTSL